MDQGSNQNKNNLLKIGEAAKFLGVSIDTLRRWEKSGKIVCVKTPGGTRLYPLSALKKFRPKEAQIEEIVMEPIKVEPKTTSKYNHIYPFLSAFAGLSLFLIATITAAYLVLPFQTRELFHPELASNSNTKVLGVQAKNSNFIESTVAFILSPFNNIAEKTFTAMFPQKAEELGLIKAKTDVKNLVFKIGELEENLKQVTNSQGALRNDLLDSSLIPSDLNIYSLSASEADIGNIIIDTSGNIYPQQNTYPQLGTSDRRFFGLYLNNFNVTREGDLALDGNAYFRGNIKLGNENTDRIDFTGTVNSNIIPSTDAAYSLGNSSNRWNEGFIKTISGTTLTYENINAVNLTVSSGLSLPGSLIPIADNIYDLGSNSSRWNDIFAGGNVAIGGTLNATSAIQLNGTSINTAGTLTNVAYLNQANTFGAYNQTFDTNTLFIDASGDRIGIGTPTPSAKLDSLATTEQLRLSYNTSNYSAFTVSSAGDLIIAPSGADTSITGSLAVSSTSALALDIAGGAQFGTGNVNLIGADGKVAGLSSTYFTTDTSANLAGILTDETGTGVAVFATSPTLVTPNIGVATGTSLNLGSGALTAGAGSFTSIANSGGYTQTGTSANAFTGTSTFSNASYSALFTGGNVGIGTTTPSEKLTVSNGNLLAEYGDIKFTQATAPGAPTAAINAAAGNLNGTYSYKITFVTSSGETEGGTTSGSVSPASQQIDLSSIPTGPSGVVTSRKIYRKKSTNTDWRLVATLSDNTTTTYTDNATDATENAGALINGKNTTAGSFYYNGTLGLNITGGSLFNTSLGLSALASNTTGMENNALGYRSLYFNTTGSQNSALGMNSLYYNTTGNLNSALGYFAGPNSSNLSSSIAIGAFAATTASNQLVIGGDNATGYLTDGYIGRGVTTATPTAFTLHASGGSGTNIAGSALKIAGGQGTGTASGGSIIFQTAAAGSTGSTLNALSDRMTIDSTGNVGIGTTAPGVRLDVASIATSGSIAKFAVPSATTLAGALTGLNVDLSTNLTATNYGTTGLSITTNPTVTGATTANVAYKGISIAGNPISTTGTVAGTWTGIDITTPDGGSGFDSDITTTGIKITSPSWSTANYGNTRLLQLSGKGFNQGTPNHLLIDFADSGANTGTWSSIKMDLQSTIGNLTNVTGKGIQMMTPNYVSSAASSGNFKALAIEGGTWSSTGSGADNIFTGLYLSSGVFSTSTDAGAGLKYRGADINMPNITQSTGTLTSSGIRIANGTITTGGTQSMIELAGTGVGAGTLYGLNISGITGSTGAETGLVIGSGWDNAATFAGNVGIGTTSPGYKLDVNGTANISGAAYLGSTLNVTGTLTGGAGSFSSLANSGGYTQTGTSANAFTGTSTFSNASYSALFTGGNVGIGTTTPSEKLTVSNGNLLAEYGDIKFTQATAPGAPTAAINATAGNLNGTYSYKITFVTSSGETEGGTTSSSVSPASQQVDLTSIPTGTSGVVTSRKIYRAKSANSDWRLVATISDNTTTSYTDNATDATENAGALINGKNTTAGSFYYNGALGLNLTGGTLNNTSLGLSALSSNTTGNNNTAVGYRSLYSNTTGFNNTALGNQSLNSNTTGNNNTALGLQSLYSNTTGAQNTALGHLALYSNTTGNNNYALGYQSLYSNTTGYYNTALGFQPLYSNTTGNNNTALGIRPLYSNTTGNYNTALGYYSLYSNTTGINNTALGIQAGYTSVAGNANTTGSNNTFLGYNSGPGTSTQLTNATAIGNAAVVSCSNCLTLGSINGINGATADTNVGIGTTAPAYKLEVAGNVSNTGLLRFGTGAATGPYTICIDAGNWFGGCTSDQRLKQNISYLNSQQGLDVITQLKPATFDYIDGPKNWSGFIAQDVMAVIPGAVRLNDNGYYVLEDKLIIPYTVKALQELNQTVTENNTAQADINSRILGLEARLKTLEEASPSSELERIVAEAATSSASLATTSSNLEDLTVSGIFKSLGEAFLGKTTIAGDLAIDGTMSLNGDSISSIGILNLQNGVLGELVSIFNGKVEINKEGQIKATSVVADQFNTKANTTSGSAKIESGKTSIVITNTYIKDNSRILITPTTLTSQTPAVINKIVGESFEVAVSTNTYKDITFDYFIINEQ